MVLKIREPGSAFTHLAGVVLTLLFALPLIIRAGATSKLNGAAMTVFVVSMLLLYMASTTYHSVSVSKKILKIFRKIDHMMIFVLIAGSYTPVCLIVLKGKLGMGMLLAVWGIAIAGILFKAFWVTCPKWVSSLLYILMGWTCVFAFTPIMHSLSRVAFLWLFFGGVIYTIGGIIYALKLQVFNSLHKQFGSHEIFHLFVLAGSFCHFVFMYQYVANLP